MNRKQILTIKGDKNNFNPSTDNQAISEPMTGETYSNALWTLVQADDENKFSDLPTFTIQLSQGELQPKLVRCKSTKKIFVTTKD